MSSHRSPESIEALNSGDKAHSRATVLALVRSCREHGATADEAEYKLGLRSNSVAPRISELVKAGLLVELHDGNGERVRRLTRDKCFARVVVAPEFAPNPSRPESRSFPEFGDLAPQRWRDDG